MKGIQARLRCLETLKDYDALSFSSVFFKWEIIIIK